LKILIIVTDIQSDKAAIEFGGLLARVTSAATTLLHVARDQTKKAEGERILSEAEDMLPDLSVNTNLCTGKLVSRSLTELRENPYDLVVIGDGQRLPLAQGDRRQLAQALVNRSEASVVVARRPRRELKRILICTGGIQVSEQVIQAGAFLAKAAGAQATLLHVAGTIPSMYTGLDEIDESLTELLKTDTPTARHLRHSAALLQKFGVTAQLELRHGVVASEINREATKGQYDLIIIGAPERRQRFKRWLLGNVTGAIVERAPCPVLIVKGPLGDRTEQD
jgi:nucleotide-binding universal stress UspA family protein